MKESEELIEAAITGDIVRIKSCVENGDRLNDDLDEIYQTIKDEWKQFKIRKLNSFFSMRRNWKYDSLKRKL